MFSPHRLADQRVADTMLGQFSRAAAVFGLLLLCGGACGAEPNSPSQLDLLIVAPHSDDEAIGCTGLILRAIADYKRPGVVVLTAGDGFPQAAAAAAKKPLDRLTADDFVALATLRQRHSIEAMRRLGLRAEDLLFLGYPDGGLAAIADATTETPYRQPHTGKSETYGPIVHDYHRTVHGRPAPYRRASIVGDLAEIVRTRRPQAIYVTGDADTHADHRAAFRLTRDAVRAAEFTGELFTFVVHGEPPPTPPDVRLKLREAELQTKRTLLESYQVGVSPVHDRLAETYTQPEELFWRVR